MSNLKKSMAKTGCALSGIFYFIIGIVGILIHLWTVLIALGESGFIAAAITFVSPLVSQAYWGFVAWHNTGTVFNTYCVALISYTVLSLLSMFAMGFFVSKVDEQDLEQ